MSRSAQSQKPEGRLRLLGSLLYEFGEPLATVVIGLALGIAGLLGWITRDTLTAVTLLVLSGVALSLLRERSLRVKANKNIESLGTRLTKTTDAVNAIQSGNPYTVLAHETTWDILEADGSLVKAIRTKHIRFDQNDVASLFDIAEGDGTRDIEYSPGKNVGVFLGEGRWLTLIALGRIFYRGDELPFKVTRISKNAFMNDHESVNTLTRDATAEMSLTIVWPKDRPPTAVRLGRATPTRDWRNEDVLGDLTTNADGRKVYRFATHNPPRGGSTTIEWEW